MRLFDKTLLPALLFGALGCIVCAPSDAIELVAELSEGLPPSEALLTLEPVAGTGGDHPPRSPQSVTLQIPGSYELDLPPQTIWKISGSSDLYWIPEQTLESRNEPFPLEVAPAGFLRGRLQTAKKEPLPTSLDILFVSSDDDKPVKQRLVQSTVCPVIEGTFRCQLPAGTVDLRLTAEHFAAAHHADQLVAPFEETDLGLIELHPGFVLAGRVQNGAEHPVDGVDITLEPHRGQRRERLDENSLAALSYTTKTSPQGLFEVRNLGLGSYAVEAKKKGFSELRSPGIKVGPAVDRGRVLTLTLHEPFDLEIAITPGTPPTSGAWSIWLAPESGAPPIEQLVPPNGLAVVPDIGLGEYWFQVRDEGGMVVFTQERAVSAEDAFWPIELDMTWVEGEVRLGGEPLAAELFFGGRSGSTSVPIQTDDTGAFAGWLPRSGKWSIDVLSTEPKVFRKLRKVAVERNDATGTAWLEVDLPDHSIGGVVVDSLGAAVPRAHVLLVLASAEENPSYQVSDSDGAFEFAGLAVGSYHVEGMVARGATTKSTTSVDIELTETATPEPVELVVLENETVQGRLLSEHGPVAGATVKLYPMAVGDFRSWRVERTTSGADGSFILDAPAQVRSAVIEAQVPGFVWTKEQIQLRAGEEITIMLETDRGQQVELTFDGPDPREGEHTELFATPFLRDSRGNTFSWNGLQDWANANGGEVSVRRLVVPALASETYSFCWPPSQDSSIAQSHQQCSSGFLSRGTTLSLSLETQSGQGSEDQQIEENEVSE